eukprot:jgi/Tetstr1/455428/TSEL_042260.t1
MAGSVGLDRNNLELVKEVLNAVQKQPMLVHDPDLRFLRTFLLNFGAELPPESEQRPGGSGSSGTWRSSAHHHPGEPECEEDDYLEEWIDHSLMAPETLPFPPAGRSGSFEPTDDDIDRAAEHKIRGSEALEQGRHAEAVEQFTLALQYQPSALLYARRAEALLCARRPSAALRDCDHALNLNADSAKALKTRGKVNRAMGEWERACQDLSQGLSIDFDQESSDLHKVCLERAQVVNSKRRARQERTIGRDMDGKQAQSQQDSIPSSDGHHGSGQSDDNENRFDNIGVAELMDPDMVAAMQNPRIFEAVKEMMRDPASAMKYTNDPEIAPVLKKMAGQGKPAGSSS